jgi:hypothetical protein
LCRKRNQSEHYGTYLLSDGKKSAKGLMEKKEALRAMTSWDCQERKILSSSFLRKIYD